MNITSKILLLLTLLITCNTAHLQSSISFDYDNIDPINVSDSLNKIKYSDPNAAIGLIYQALEYYLPKGPSRISISLYNILGEIYLKKDLPVLALSNFVDASLEFDLCDKKSLKNPKLKQQPWILINLGNIYFNEGQILKAVDKYNDAEENFMLLEDPIHRDQGLTTTYNNMALICIESGKYFQALELYNRSLKIRDKHNKVSDLAHSYKSICELYYKWNKPDKGAYYANIVDSLNKAYLLSYNVNENSVDWTDALNPIILESLPY